MKKNAYIIFSREPVPGQTKTRLMPYYTPEQCVALHCCFLKDYRNMSADVDADIFICYDSDDGKCVLIKEIFGEEAHYLRQHGDDLNMKMYNAFSDVLALGYESCILTGADIPELTSDSVNYAFNILSFSDAVIGRTTDGGYYLIGLHKPCPAPFHTDMDENSSVFENTVNAMREAGLRVNAVHEYPDIDVRKDIDRFRCDMKTSHALRTSATGRFIANTAAVSILVPVYNEEKIIVDMQEMLKQYLSQAEIIFVDGGSTDRTCELISDEFKLIHSDKGRALQLNRAAEAATGDILYFLHCDSIIPADIISEIRRVSARHYYGAFGVKFESHHIFMKTNTFISNFRAFIRGIPFGDQGMFIDRNLFFKMGMFKALPVMEDYDFALRMKSAGYRPGKTKHRIITSTRRYEGSWYSVMLTEYRMWKIRRDFIKGKDPYKLSDQYTDVR